MDKYDCLKLENQICFPLYAASKEIIRMYKPFLDKLDLTYTQYIVMMVMWESKTITVKDLGEQVYLDSGTLTPLLKKLETKGYVKRKRSEEDERNLFVSITDLGMELREKAIDVPSSISRCVSLREDKAIELYKTLHEILSSIKEKEN